MTTITTMTVADLSRWVHAFAGLVTDNRTLLTELDAAIGDADHGSNMTRGMAAAVEALQKNPPADAGALLSTVGMTLVSTVGGASGPLFGTFFLRMGSALAARTDVSPGELLAALDAGTGGVVARGKAGPADKTMYDALAPAVDAFRAAVDSGAPLSAALDEARTAARAGRDATTPMVARKGRASYLGQRSVGHQDPGATTVALLFEAAAAELPGEARGAEAT